MNQFSTLLNKTDVPANILCIDQFSTLGREQRSLLDLLPAFSDRGWRPSVAAPDGGPFLPAARRLGYRTHNVAYRGYANKKKPLSQAVKYAFELPSLVRSLAELVEHDETDLLYVNGPRLVPSAAWVAWRRGIPLVFHCHDRLQQYSAITITGQALELASAHVIACCQHAADPLREYVPPERMTILYGGASEMPASHLQTSGKIRRIGVVGRIEKDEGHLQFVQAARLILQHAPECRFLILGTPALSDLDYYRQVVASIRDLPIDLINCEGDTANVYSELDLLVVPSSTGRSAMHLIPEAHSAEVPVVAFPAAGIPEILQDNQTGFLTLTSTVEALVQRIISVLQMDETKIRAVTRRAREQWRDRFTVEAYRESVCNVLAEAIHPIFHVAYEELCATAAAGTGEPTF